jgi:putative DNA primase/helicase
VTYEQVLARFPDARRTGEGKAIARCPAHEDKTASLAISSGADGRTVMHCHAGCGTTNVLAAVGLSECDLFADERPAPNARLRIVATYRYADGAGTLRYEIVRFQPKDFRPRRPGPDGKWIWNLSGVERIPYLLPETLAAPANTPIYIVEGERDCDALVALGMVATTNPGGCGSTKLWDTRPFQDPFVGNDVAIIPDADEPGTKHAAHVAESLAKVAKSIKIVRLPVGKDASDWIEAGGTAEKLRELVQATEVWTPTTATGAKAAPSEVVTADDPSIASDGAKRSYDGVLEDALATQRFADLIRGRALYATDALAWYRYDGSRWVRDSGECWLLGEAIEVAKAYLRDALNDPLGQQYKARLAIAKRYNTVAGRRKLIEGATASNLGLTGMAAQFDCDPWSLNVQNGTVDLCSGKLRPHNPADKITKLAPVTYDPAAKCPRWEQFLIEVLPDRETIAFVRTFVGFCLSGSTKNHVVVFLCGLGANGKSVLCETVGALLGDYAAVLPASVLMAKEYQGHACEIMPLRGARWALFPELPAGKFDEPRVKAFASADSMTARNLFEGPVAWKPTHKVVLTGNHKPIVRGQDEGIWRRLKLIPFDRVIPPERRDLDLPAKLRAELPGILNWALDGCAAWQRDPQCLESACAAIVAATAGYREESDRLAAWLADCCTLAPENRVSRSVLRASYETWCTREGEHPIHSREFGEGLRRRDVHDGKLWQGGQSVRCWEGIGLLTGGGNPGHLDTSGQQNPLSSMDSVSRGDLGGNGVQTCPGVQGSGEAPDPLAQLGHCLRVRPDTTASDADRQALAKHFLGLTGTAEAAGQRLWSYWKAATVPTVTDFLAAESKAKGGAA